MRTFSLVAGAAFVLPTATLTAQQPRQLAPTPSPETCVTVEAGRVECRTLRRTMTDSVYRLRRAEADSALMRRAALGMELSTTGSLRDTLGVFVSHVTPKGPAETAGVIEGDRIAAINGVDLRISAADAGDSYASGLPAHRLSREVAKLVPGSRVNLRVYSAGRIRDVQVTAGRASEVHRTPRALGFWGDGPGNTMIFREPLVPLPAMPALPPDPALPRLRLDLEQEVSPLTEDAARGFRMLMPSRRGGRTIRI